MNALWLDNWTIVDRETTKTSTTITATYAVVPDSCPKCGVIDRLYKHGEKVVEYRDAPAYGKRVTIAVKVKRFRCRECGAVINQPLPDMHPNRQMTLRCAEHLQEQCLTRNYAEMSRETGVDESVIRSLCNEGYEKLKAIRRPIAPAILGIDELTLHRRRRLIVVDVTSKTILDLLPTMTKATVVHWLSHMEAKENVKVVTIDMWKDYRSAVHGVLPGASVVIDKWHIQKMANEALDHVRSRDRKGATTKAGKKNPWATKRLLMARTRNLSPARALILDGLLKNNPLVADAHRAKEGFYDIWEAETREAAEVAYAAWKAAIPASVELEFGALCRTVENWRTEIFAYFDHRYTNAFTEAMNGLVKIINREGRGYSFEHIRAKILSAQEEPAMPDTIVCECCLGHFAVPLIEVHHIRPFGTGKAKSIRMCPTCHRRFHLEGVYAAHRDSTLKNG